MLAREKQSKNVKEAEDHLAAVIDHTPIAVITFHDDGTVLNWNKAAERIYGWTAAEVVGKPLPIYEKPEELASVMAANLLRNFQQGCEQQQLHKDGHSCCVEVWSAHVTDGPSYHLHMCADSEEKKSLREQIQQSQKLETVGRMAGSIAHDFNNMLTVITTYSHWLIGCQKDAETRSWAEECLKAANRAAELTKNLLAFSKRQVIHRRVLSLNYEIRHWEKILRQTVGENIELRLKLGQDTGWIRADAGQVQQILLNLVMNARDAMPTGGELVITTENAEFVSGLPSAPYVRLTVSDTGYGMTTETKAHVFEPFFTTKPAGTGIGLATVYMIVTQNEGAVHVDSEPNIGTTFKIYLPREFEEPAVDTMPSSNPQAAAQELVLLVEDEDAVRKLVKQMLQRAGYRVIDTSDVQQAIWLAEEHIGQVKLLLTDVVMPQMSGLDLAKRLRESNPHLKVLFMSGYAEAIVENQGVIELESEFLQKPFQEEDLLTKARTLIDLTN